MIVVVLELQERGGANLGQMTKYARVVVVVMHGWWTILCPAYGWEEGNS